MSSPRDEALTLLRRAREELEGVSAFINRDKVFSLAADEQMDVWARVQQATNVVEKLMSELSTLASYEFAAAADVRKVSALLAAKHRTSPIGVPHTITTPEESAE
jgi:hypothetical protein